jgi:hypothetical protein
MELKSNPNKKSAEPGSSHHPLLLVFCVTYISSLEAEYFPPKCLSVSELHGVITLKTKLCVIATVRTSNPRYNHLFITGYAISVSVKPSYYRALFQWISLTIVPACIPRTLNSLILLHLLQCPSEHLQYAKLSCQFTSMMLIQEQYSV